MSGFEGTSNDGDVRRWDRRIPFSERIGESLELGNYRRSGIAAFRRTPSKRTFPLSGSMGTTVRSGSFERSPVPWRSAATRMERDGVARGT